MAAPTFDDLKAQNRTVYRDAVAPGTTEANDPLKSDIRALNDAQIDKMVEIAASASAGRRAFATVAERNAWTERPVGAIASVEETDLTYRWDGTTWVEFVDPLFGVAARAEAAQILAEAAAEDAEQAVTGATALLRPALPAPMAAADGAQIAAARLIGGTLDNDSGYVAGTGFSGWVFGIQITETQTAAQMDVLVTSTADATTMVVRVFERQVASAYVGPPSAEDGDLLLTTINHSLSGGEQASGSAYALVSVPLGGLRLLPDRYVLFEVTMLNGASPIAFGTRQRDVGSTVVPALRGYFRNGSTWSVLGDATKRLSVAIWGEGGGDLLAAPRRAEQRLEPALTAIGDTLEPLTDTDATNALSSAETAGLVGLAKVLPSGGFIDAVRVNLADATGTANSARVRLYLYDADYAVSRPLQRKRIDERTTSTVALLPDTAARTVDLPLNGLYVPAGGRVLATVELLDDGGDVVSIGYGIASLGGGEDGFLGGVRRPLGTALAYDEVVNGGYRVWGEMLTLRSRLGESVASLTLVNTLYATASSEIAQLGDSRTDEGGTGTATQEAIGWQAYAEIFSGGRVTLPPSLNFGVNGDTTAGMLARIATVAASPVTAVTLLAGTNDPAGSITISQSIANLTAIYQALRAAGKSIFVINELPRSDAGATADARTHRMRLHNWYAEVMATWAGVTVIDPSAILSDPTSTTWAPLPGYLRDGIHLSPRGALVIGRMLAQQALNPAFPTRQRLSVTAADLWASDMPQANLVPASMMAGSVPASTYAGTGAGDVPTGWLPVLENGAGLTLVWAVVVIDGYRWTQLTITGTPTEADPLVRLVKSIPTSSLTSGDVIYGSFGIQLDAGSTGVRGLFGYTAVNAATAYSGNLTGGNFLLGPEAISGVQAIPKLTAPVGSIAAASIGFGLGGYQGEPLNAVVRWGQPAVRKVA